MSKVALARRAARHPVTVPARLAFGSRGVVRLEHGSRAYEAALLRRTLGPIAGVDEAGRGACAGPLTVAACVLPAGRRGHIDGLTDSKQLTEAARERFYDIILDRATAWSVICIPPSEIDAWGLHVANVSGMRRAVAALAVTPGYVLTDGFPVSGIGAPSTAVWKGDQVVSCISAASVIAKVTRDRLMTRMDANHPNYGFAVHKGYVTAAHERALNRFGPCTEHRQCYVNVQRAGQAHRLAASGETDLLDASVD